MKLLVIATLLLTSMSCIHPKIKYRKKKLLDPIMDNTKSTSLLTPMLLEATQWTERSASAGGTTLQGNCPTCGG